MSRLITFILALSLIIQFSCAKEEDKQQSGKMPLRFINISRQGGPIDTIYSRLDSSSFGDSIYNLSYTEIDYEGDTLRQVYELPISNSPKTFQHLKDTSEYRLQYKGLRYIKYDRQYTVYKYLLDDPHGEDEEMNYYFVPEYGIVLIRSRAWGGYGRLVSNSEEQDFDKIFYLTEKIVGGFHDFYMPDNN